MLAVLACHIAFSQIKNDTYYTQNPVWIQMMDAEHTNYNEAIKAFELYWQNREKPTQEDELFRASNEEKEKKDFIKSNKRDDVKYAFEYKKFLKWQQKVLAYLNEDGTVMNAEERIALWKNQLENRK